jgi:hypothetical protein
MGRQANLVGQGQTKAGTAGTTSISSGVALRLKKE